MSQDIEILRRARALLDERGWSRGATARDERGRPVDPTSLEAAIYCSVGAILAVSATEPAAKAAVLRLRAALDGTPVARWNDNAEDVFEVLAGFDAAIKQGACQ